MKMKTIQDVINENEEKVIAVWLWLNGKLLASQLFSDNKRINVGLRKIEVNKYEIIESNILSIELNVESFKNAFKL